MSDTETFTADTRPTADQVTNLIERSGRCVYAVIGSYDDLEEADPDLFGAVLDVITTRAAAEVEISYFPETTDTQASQTVLDRRYEADLKRLEQALRERRSSGSVTPGDAMLPMGGSMDDCGPVFGSW